MTNDLKRVVSEFDLLLEHYPFAKPYFDMENRECKVDAIREMKGSSSERIVVHFLANVWIGEDEFPVSLLDIAGTLGDKQRLPIVEWLRQPFWP